MARSKWSSRIASWNAGDADYWDTAQRTTSPGEAAQGATDWAKTLVTIILVIGGGAVLIFVVLPLLLCLLMLILGSLGVSG